MAITGIELKSIAQRILSGHRPEVVSLVSMFWASTASDTALQELCLPTLYLAVCARMREVGGDMDEFNRCAQDMRRAAITVGVLNQCPD